MNEDKMPLFLINGFLEAGKTQFIKFTMPVSYTHLTLPTT